MLSNFDAAVEAALIRKEISSREIADENRSGQRGNNFELKNSNGKVVSRISMERVEQLKDPEALAKAFASASGSFNCSTLSIEILLTTFPFEFFNSKLFPLCPDLFSSAISLLEISFLISAASTAASKLLNI